MTNILKVKLLLNSFYLVFIAIIISNCSAPNSNKTREQKPFQEVADSLDMDWNLLNDTIKYMVTYLQVNLDPIGKKDFGKKLIDFKDDKKIKRIILNGKQQILLQKFITTNEYFLNADCGTFTLNGGFLITKSSKEVGTIELGCGFNQWIFQPDNQFAKAGSVNNKGFNAMRNLLDNILSKK